jgi:hypothetical protein
MRQCRHTILLRQPLIQPLVRRRHRHNVRVALLFAHFDQLRHRWWLHGAQADQKGFVLLGLPAHQQVHCYFAAGVRLYGAITLHAVPRQQFDQMIFLCEFHVPSYLLSIMLPSPPGVQHAPRTALSRDPRKSNQLHPPAMLK